MRPTILFLLLAAACAHTRPTETTAAVAECARSAPEIALAVRDQSQRFSICAQLDGQNEYVLGFVATPEGDIDSVLLLGGDLEPITGQAPACFAAVMADIGLARSGGGECRVTVPLIVPGAVRARPDAPTRDEDGWLVSALQSYP